VIEREFQRLMEAARLRGFAPKTNLFTYRTTAYLVGNLLVRSYDRSQRVYEAMLCRGFNGTFPVYHHFTLSRRDIFFGVVGGIYLFFMAIFLA
jgi:cobalt/nickel transport system permease protein